MTTITETALAKIIANTTGCTFAGLTTCTVPVLAGGKGNAMQGKVTKVTEATCFFGGTPAYGKMVNKRADAAFTELVGEKPVVASNFEPQALWKGAGEHVAGGLVRHKGKGSLYLYAFFANNSKPVSRYYLDGQPIEKAAIVGLKESDDTKTVTVDGEDVTIKLVLRTISLESINALRVDGEEYAIDHAPALQEAAAATDSGTASEDAQAGA